MNNVVIYLTPYCPYCVRAKMLLDKKEVPYTELRVDLDNDLLEEMYQRSKKFTVPQIFIGDTHVGGCDEMFLLETDNKLDLLLFPNESDNNQ